MAIRPVERSEIPPGHPVAVFHDFWIKAAGDRAVPPWSAFDALDHPAILPWVLLLKREEPVKEGEPPAWRYAVCGTGCTELFGFSYQGKLFGEGLPPEAVMQRRAEFDRVIAGAGPQFSHTTLPIPSKEFVAVFRGVFAFSAEGTKVDRLFVVIARDDVRID